MGGPHGWGGGPGVPEVEAPGLDAELCGDNVDGLAAVEPTADGILPIRGAVPRFGNPLGRRGIRDWDGIRLEHGGRFVLMKVALFSSRISWRVNRGNHGLICKASGGARGRGKHPVLGIALLFCLGCSPRCMGATSAEGLPASHAPVGAIRTRNRRDHHRIWIPWYGAMASSGVTIGREWRRAVATRMRSNESEWIHGRVPAWTAGSSSRSNRVR